MPDFGAMDIDRIEFDEGAIQALFNSPEGPVAKELAQKAVKVERIAKNLCAVDTGRLRSSIAWTFARDSQGLFAQVGSDVEYAAFIEFGTINMHAQPYLRPALSSL